MLHLGFGMHYFFMERIQMDHVIEFKLHRLVGPVHRSLTNLSTSILGHSRRKSKGHEILA